MGRGDVTLCCFYYYFSGRLIKIQIQLIYEKRYKSFTTQCQSESSAPSSTIFSLNTALNISIRDYASLSKFAGKLTQGTELVSRKCIIIEPGNKLITVLSVLLLLCLHVIAVLVSLRVLTLRSTGIFVKLNSQYILVNNLSAVFFFNSLHRNIFTIYCCLLCCAITSKILL